MPANGFRTRPDRSFLENDDDVDTLLPRRCVLRWLSVDFRLLLEGGRGSSLTIWRCALPSSASFTLEAKASDDRVS